MPTINISPYWKSVLAGLGALVTALITVTDDGAVSADEAGVIVTAVVTAVAVFVKRNAPTDEV